MNPEYVIVIAVLSFVAGHCFGNWFPFWRDGKWVPPNDADAS